MPSILRRVSKNSLYDSYIKAFRWASDRLSDEGGVICFVSNGSWIDSNAQDGMRKTIEKEFTSVHVFNLRGNQRTSGEQSRREGGKIFGSGSRTPIAITLLVKNPNKQKEKADIYYQDIGDYLKREQKLQIVKILAQHLKWNGDNFCLTIIVTGSMNVMTCLEPLFSFQDKISNDNFFNLSSWGLKNQS